MLAFAETSGDVSPKEPEAVTPHLSSHDEEEPSCSEHQGPKSPQTSRGTPDRKGSPRAGGEDATAQAKSERLEELRRRPLQARMVHLLALKPHKTEHLIRRLKRDGLTRQQEASLLSTLAQVADRGGGETVVLKESLFMDVEEGWPGYLIEERHLLGRILLRKAYQAGENQEPSQIPSPYPLDQYPSRYWKRPRLSRLFKKKESERSPPRTLLPTSLRREEEESGSRRPGGARASTEEGRETRRDLLGAQGPKPTEKKR